MDWALSILTIIMNVLLGKKNKWGWVLMLLVSILWIIYSITLDPPQYGLLPAVIANIVIAIPSAIKWFKEDKK